MSAQGKPGYFVNKATGWPDDHVADGPCGCPACHRQTDEELVASAKDMARRFVLSSDEEAAVLHMMRQGAAMRSALDELDSCKPR